MVTVSLGSIVKNCMVTVNATPTYAVRLENSFVKLIPGKEFQLQAGLYRGNAAVEGRLSYQSDNEAVATVDEGGNIRALTVGTCSIRVSAQVDGKTYSNDVALQVILAAYIDSAESIELAYNSSTTLSYVVKDLNDDNPIEDAVATVTSSNPSVLEVSGNTLKALDVASCTVTLVYGDTQKVVNVSIKLPVEKAEYNAFSHNASLDGAQAVDRSNISNKVKGLSIERIEYDGYSGNCLVMDNALLEKAGASKYTCIVLPSRTDKAGIEALQAEGYRYLTVRFRCVAPAEFNLSGAGVKCRWSTASSATVNFKADTIGKWQEIKVPIQDVIDKYEILCGGFDTTSQGTMGDTSFLFSYSEDNQNAIKLYIQPIFFTK